MLYCEEVISICKESLHPLCSRTIAKKLNIKPKEARASLYYAKHQDPNLQLCIRAPSNVVSKKPIWFYINAMDDSISSK